MKKPIIILAILMILLLQASKSFAQNAPETAGTLELKQSVIASGGGAHSGGVFSLESTLGQPLAGTLSQNGGFSLLSGFQTSLLPVQNGSLVISGQVTNGGNALAGVTVVLNGNISATAVTNAAGNYSFTGLASGANFTVTPFFSNFAFNPPSSTFNNLTANQTASFAAAPCTFVLNSTSTNAPSSGANGTISLTTSTAGCTWTAVSNDNWITVSNAGRGIGSGTVSFVVAPNNGQAARTGTVVAAGQNYTVTQSGVSGFAISGTISYGTTAANQAAKFVSGVNLQTTGTAQMSAVSDNSGFYQLSGLTQGGNYTVTPSKTGNANGISAFDATIVLRCVAAGSNCALTPNQRLAADTNADNSVSAFDATQILRYVAANGSNANTGQAGSWRFSPAPRNYGTVSNSLSNENYIAVLTGEVNGDWTPPGVPASLATPEETGQETQNSVEPASVSESENISEQNADDTQTETSGKSEAAQMEISMPAEIAAISGSTILIPVRLDNHSGKRISAYSFAVRFDPKALQPEGAETNETLSGNGFMIVSDKNTRGRIGVAASNPNRAIEASGTLVYLRFKVVGAAGDSSILRFQTTAPDKATFEDNAGSIVAAARKNGKITVSTAPTADVVSVAGRVLTADGRGIRNVLVSLADGQGNTKTVLTGVSGYYRFADVPRGATYTITVAAKKFGFNQSSQSRLIAADTDEVNFTADSLP